MLVAKRSTSAASSWNFHILDAISRIAASGAFTGPLDLSHGLGFRSPVGWNPAARGRAVFYPPVLSFPPAPSPFTNWPTLPPYPLSQFITRIRELRAPTEIHLTARSMSCGIMNGLLPAPLQPPSPPSSRPLVHIYRSRSSANAISLGNHGCLACPKGGVAIYLSGFRLQLLLSTHSTWGVG